MKKKGLGKGLGALIPAASDDIKNTNLQENQGVFEIKVSELNTNIEQPRKNFDDDKLNELAGSIQKHGIIQPIIVKKENGMYSIVAGERRWRAAKIAGLEKIPVVIKEITNKEVMEIALIENIQREDLNPIEEAEAYNKLLKEYDITQEELSKTIGKSRSAISNTMRLLMLQEDVRMYLINEEITSGHARALLSISNLEIQKRVAKEIIEKELNVRETEKLVKSVIEEKDKKKKKKEVVQQEEEYKEIENMLKDCLGTKVTLANKKNKGKIIIEYYSNEELDRIVETFSSIKVN